MILDENFIFDNMYDILNIFMFVFWMIWFIKVWMLKRYVKIEKGVVM